MPESTGEGSCSQHREIVVFFVVQVCLLDFECEKIGITKRNGGKKICFLMMILIRKGGIGYE